MPVSYNGKKLIPAPQVEISKEYLKTADGQKVGSTFSITLDGVMIPHMGSPNSAGSFHTAKGYPADDNIEADKIQYSLFKKSEAVRDLFSIEGKLLSITTRNDEYSVGDDTKFPAISGYARINSINFPQALYNSPTSYTINLELDEVMGMNTASTRLGSEDFRNAGVTVTAESGTNFSLDSNRVYLSSISEDWSVEDAGTSVTVHYPLIQDFTSQTISASGSKILNTGQKVYTVTHSISAVGKRTYDANGLIKQPKEWAQQWVIPKLCTGESASPSFNAISGIAHSAGLSGIANMNAYDYVRSVQEESTGGSYSVSETWTISPVSAIETVNVETSYSYDTDIYSTSINGTITGFETRNCNMEVSVDKYTQALNYFANSEQYVERYKSNYSSIPYSYISQGKEIPTSKSISKNPSEGSISYSFSFEDRADNLGVGAITENISIQYTDSVPKVAALDVPGRTAGPVIQDLGTKSVASVTITIDATVKVNNGTSTVSYDTLRTKCANQIIKYVPSSAELYWITNDGEGWDPWTGKYNRAVTYQYQ